ncbi:MAG TPA: electron transfer flavoprotein subunit beta/FixA family protein [Euzebyales bacterium]|nr:electron transfer flavoprotein subunit beta/FixA family protein [Euzebyales bacterium]
MRIICPVKRVPDTAATKHVDPDDHTVDRDRSDPVLNANDEWAIEEALQIAERTPGTQIIALCMGPDEAGSTVRKALSYGLDGAIQVTDPALAGSDAAATARVLAGALAGEDYDLIVMGNQSSDARTMLVPAMLAAHLGVPALTFVRDLQIDGDVVTAQRETPAGYQVVRARRPVVVSVVEAINEPRYPTFKGIMAAKKKTIDVRDLAAIDVPANRVGLDGSATAVVDVVPRPPKQAGRVVTDDGSGQLGARALADWLVEQKIL